MHNSLWRATVAACALVAIGLAGSTAWAAVPRTISYQGKLTEADGTPVPPGEHVATFRLYDAATGGTKLWEEQHTITLTPTDNGVFSVVLGSQTPFSSAVNFNNPLWLTIELDGEGEFAPRQPLSAVGYAINADLLDGLDSTQLLGSTTGTAELADGAVTSAKLAADSVGAAALAATAIQAGDIEVGDLPAHAGTHQPGGSDALPTDTPASVGSSNSAGTSTSLSRADHVHQGVHSAAVSGQPALAGDVTLSAGANVTLTQSGQDIQIASTGGTVGNRASAFASSTVELGEGSDTDLVSVSITKSQASSAILLLATVQLRNASGSKRETTLKLFRGSTQLDASYTIKHGGKNDPTGRIPITLHALDETTATGSLTYTLKGSADDEHVEATVRRFTALELL